MERDSQVDGLYICLFFIGFIFISWLIFSGIISYFIYFVFIAISAVCVVYTIVTCCFTIYESCKLSIELRRHRIQQEVVIPEPKIEIVVIQNPNHISLGYKYEPEE